MNGEVSASKAGDGLGLAVDSVVNSSGLHFAFVALGL